MTTKKPKEQLDFRITIEAYGRKETFVQYSKRGHHRDPGALWQDVDVGRALFGIMDKMRRDAGIE